MTSGPGRIPSEIETTNELPNHHRETCFRHGGFFMKGRLVQTQLSSQGRTVPNTPVGGFVNLDGEQHYRISSYGRLSPFLVSLASDTDLWMFITSGGGLTAGRVDAEGSLFPYLTVDQLHNAHHHTGPLTLIHVEQENQATVLWEPFSDSTTLNPGIERNLYKNIIGNRLVFEEINHDLDLAFRYSWSGCDEFGWVRTATLENRGNSPVRTTLLDGLRNVLPHGAPLSLYQQASNLVDAYKKTEIDPETGLGLFSLTAGITDKAEALEILQANTVWCCGLEEFRIHLSLETVSAFKHHRVVSEETTLNGTRGNFLVSCSVELEPQEFSQWHLIADVGLDHVQIAELRHNIQNNENLDDLIKTALLNSGKNLRRNVGSADGLQLSGNPDSSNHHFANVLFNNMRGGIFARNYELPVADFADFLQVRNHKVAEAQESLLQNLPDTITVQELKSIARKTDDLQFERLCFEYLPLHFGRRHGDPSRPWNKFSIQVRNQKGEKALNYQGNWRDIFQNWEALCTSFPGFLPSIVAKFVNASTIDGFNPYRITRDGVDWETSDPEDPWANIGYWGDHQIIYLLKLLESMNGHDPSVFTDLLGKDIFSYSEVPYIIKPYAEILKDPKATIDFDTPRAKKIDHRVAENGMDGKLLTNKNGSVYQVNLLEKLLVPALAKLSNLIPDAGIWMNTQRPEWNDANNALAGGGVSVVTLCYLRRYLAFLADALDNQASTTLPISTEVAVWFEKIGAILENERNILDQDQLDARNRQRLLESLGRAFSDYRDTVYAAGFAGKSTLSTNDVTRLCRTALEYLEWGIRANRREDGLYHSYNLLEFSADGKEVEVLRLQEMLEGQVAVLSSRVLEPSEALEILTQLFASPLYRADQHSFMLYPERQLPSFLAKNEIPQEKALAIPLVKKLLSTGDKSIILRDRDGVFRFSRTISKARDVANAIDHLDGLNIPQDSLMRDKEAILELFEDVFKHKSYTGRSGMMYGYEGLGCIYWHMVAKLLLSVQEIVLQARREDQPPALQQALAQMYYRVRSGLGYEKSVAEYGAFPTDPYSHTPANGGAKQPGMTGQVKEEILTRQGELGIQVENGTLSFRPILLRSTGLLAEEKEFEYFDIHGESRSIPLPSQSLAFTICQVPVIYKRVSGMARIGITFADGSTTMETGQTLGVPLSEEIFARSGRIVGINLEIPEGVFH
jgi:hypothetical protein